MIKVCQRRTELALSPGKRKGLQAVSNPRGVIAAMAIDQRDALRGLFAAELKVEKNSVPREQLEEFKSIVVRALSPYASAVLLDPGIRSASSFRAPPILRAPDGLRGKWVRTAAMPVDYHASWNVGQSAV